MAHGSDHPERDGGMRGMFRNKRTIWYANYVGQTEDPETGLNHTGRYLYEYTKPKMLRVNKSTTSGLTNNNISGKVKRHPYGGELDYNVTINPLPPSCDISEGSVLWVDTEPVIKEDGYTDTPYDHVVTRISYSLGWRAMQAVKVDRASGPIDINEDPLGDEDDENQG